MLLCCTAAAVQLCPASRSRRSCHPIQPSCCTCPFTWLSPHFTQPPACRPACLPVAAFRLRHVQSITLKQFEPACQLQRDAQLFYELWRGLPDGGHQLLYVSEQVGLGLAALQ